MKKIILILSLITSVNISVYPQSVKRFYSEKTYIYKPSNNDTSFSKNSLNPYFTYMFIENTSVEFSNAKGFGLDLQYNQNNYTSWMLGFNISFYKLFNKNVGTKNQGTLNLLAGPKFYFSTSGSSGYFRINTGITYFSNNSHSGIPWCVTLFPALGFEQNLNKVFKIFIESTANANIDLMGVSGHFSINIGMISSL
ncbi:MAG: hypothetical protein HY959_08015 [Ignavibacteriae bacterium]|nr:hypothetical protein [Ignavibacteriota bacterium]